MAEFDRLWLPISLAL